MKLKNGLELIDSFHLKIQTDDDEVNKNEIRISSKNENNVYSDNSIDIATIVNLNTNDIDNKCQHIKSISENRKEYFELFEKMKILASSLEERNFKIYFRTSGALLTLLKNCKRKCELLINDSHNDCVEHKLNHKNIDGETIQKDQKINKIQNNGKAEYVNSEIVKYLNLISVLIESERSSLSRTAESGLINTVKLLLIKLQKKQLQQQQQQEEQEQEQEREKGEKMVVEKERGGERPTRAH